MEMIQFQADSKPVYRAPEGLLFPHPLTVLSSLRVCERET